MSKNNLLELYENLYVNFEEEKLKLLKNFKNNSNEIFDLICMDMFGYSNKDLLVYDKHMNIVTKIEINVIKNIFNLTIYYCNKNDINLKFNIERPLSALNELGCEAPLYNKCEIPVILEDYNHFNVTYYHNFTMNFKIKKFEITPGHTIGKINFNDCEFLCWMTVEMFEKFKEDWRKNFEIVNE